MSSAPRDAIPVPCLLGVADEGSHRTDARSPSPAPTLAFVEVPSSFQLVRYEAGRRFPTNLPEESRSAITVPFSGA